MYLYIDPGTGSMLFTIIIGLISTLIFAFRDKFLKLKFLMSGGKAAKVDSSKLPVVIFADHKRYWNMFEPVCDEFERRGEVCYYWTASPDDPALSKGYEYVKTEFIGEGNKAFARLNMMNARVCFSTTPGLDVYQWKRSKDCDYYVHIYHAVDEGTGYRMFGIDFYDALLTSGEIQETTLRKIEDVRGIPHKECHMVGNPYMDSLKARYEERKKTDTGEGHVFTVLLAPSWGPDSILNKYGERILKALKDTGFKIIVRAHPQTIINEKDFYEGLVAKFPENENFVWDRSNDNFETLYQSDIMITDFSGIIFDYTYVFDRPLMYADTSMDTAPYDAAWLDEEVWRLAILPDLGLKLSEEDFPRMKEVIESVSDNERYAAGRERYRNESWQIIGNSASNIVDYLLNKNNELMDRDTEKDKNE